MYWATFLEVHAGTGFRHTLNSFLQGLLAPLLVSVSITFLEVHVSITGQTLNSFHAGTGCAILDSDGGDALQ